VNEPGGSAGSPGTIRVLIAEDQAMVLGALAQLLDIEPDLSVVARARNGTEALTLAREVRPDVVVTDIEMPGTTGLELAGALRELQPRPRVIIVTTFARPGYLRRALDAGVSGYLLKDAPAEELAEAVRRVQSWRPRPGARRTRSPTGSARSCARPARGSRPPPSPPASTSPKGRCATTSPRRSASSTPPTGWRRRGSRGARGGSSLHSS
jgi:DNA-binding NarL/FixJ family response regulator